MAAKRSDLFWAVVTVAICLVVIILAGWALLGGNFTISNQPDDANQNPSDQTAAWNTITNNQYGFSMKYPSGFFDAGHEAKVLVGDCNYSVFPGSCPNVEKITNQELNHLPAGTKVTINNATYCKYQTQDAAMGHQYYFDYYAIVKNQKCVVVDLETSTTTCENYLPLQTGNAEQQTNYNNCVSKRDNRQAILNQIVNTFTSN